MRRINILSILCFTLLLLASCNNHNQVGNIYNVEDYGAKGDGKTDNAKAIQKAIDACNKAGGGTVIIPAGKTFMCGPIHLASNIDLHLEPNSRLLANPNEDIYKESAFGPNEGEGMMWISERILKIYPSLVWEKLTATV